MDKKGIIILVVAAIISLGVFFYLINSGGDLVYGIYIFPPTIFFIGLIVFFSRSIKTGKSRSIFWILAIATLLFLLFVSF